jgi:hypothetical protein
MSPEIHFGLVHYTKQVDPWFDVAENYNFATATDFLNWLQAGTRISFVQKASQAPDVPRPLKEQYLKCYQKVCADAQTNPNPIIL